MYPNLWASGKSSTNVLALTSLQIQEMFFQFVEGDSRVRRYLVQCLETHMVSISPGHLHYETTAFQLAFCYYLGFGTARQTETAERLVRESGQSFETPEKQIEQIKMAKAPRFFRSDYLTQLAQQGLLSYRTTTNEYGSSESWESARPVLAREIQDLVSVLGNEHEAVNTLRYRLSNIYQQHGLFEDAEAIEIEAIKSLMNVSKLPRFSVDPERRNTKVTQNSPQMPPPLVIQTPQLANKSPIFDIVDILDNRNSPDMTRAMYDLVTIYIRQHRWTEAEWLSIRLREALASVLGEEDPHTLRSTYLIGFIYREQGRSKEAERIYCYSLQVSKISLGDSHEQTLQIYGDLAQLYQHGYYHWKGTEKYSTPLATSLLKKSVHYEPEYRSQLKDSAALEEAFLEIGNKFQLSANPDMSVIAGISSIVAEHHHQRHFKEAEALVLQLIEICKRTLPNDHPETLSGMETLGLLWKDLERLNEAERMLEEVFEKRSRVLGRSDEETLDAASNLAVIYMKLKKARKAETLLQETVSAQRVALGENHSKTWITMTNLAVAYQRCGKPAAAIELLEDTLARQREVLGAAHNQVFQASTHLGQFYLKESRADDAERLCRSLITSQENELGVDHPVVLDSLLRLATALTLQNRLREATQLVERHHAGTTRVFNKTSREALQSLNSLGIAYFREERWEEGEEVFRGLAAEAKIVLGPDDRLTKAAETNIARGDAKRRSNIEKCSM